MVRFVRKHRIALLAVAVYNLILFSPLLFLGRVLSPNDVFYKYEPWASVRPPELTVYNGLLIDPPTSYYTLMSLVRGEPEAFHWNPYIAAGVPGFGSSAAAVLSPFILLPTLLLPLPWVFTGIVFLKLNVAFAFAYAWLRHERLGKRGAAIGAIVIAGSAIYVVRWLWQMSNATALYPALLLIVRRCFERWRMSISFIVVIALSYALAGFPSAMAYGIYLAAAYAIFLCIRRRRIPVAASARVVLGCLVGFAIASPSVMPFARWIVRSGYLEMRSQAATVWFPLSHWPSFIRPLRLGTPAGGMWKGDPALGALDNFVEATIYLGVVAVVLALLALFVRRRGEAKWFWVGAAVFITCTIFGVAGIGTAVGNLPGFKYSVLSRVSALLPIAVGYLAALAGGWLAGRWRRKTIVAGVIAILAAADLSWFAVKFFPYIRPAYADIPSTPMLDVLAADQPPFRIAPFMDYLWPNTSELFRIEDVRSHFSSRPEYRRLLLRVDPGAWTGQGTYLGFHSLKFNFDDPIVGMLGIRWFLEHKSIDILKWQARGKTVPGVAENGPLPLAGELRRTIQLGERFWALEIPVELDATQRAAASLQATVEKNGRAVWSRRFTVDDIRAMGRIYIPVRPYARAGEAVTMILRPDGITGHALAGADGAVYFGRVDSPVIFERELPDGRLFRNLAEVPRFRAASHVRKLTDAQFLAARDIDLSTEAVITDDSKVGELTATQAEVSLTRYGPAEQRLATKSAGRFLLASSEKLTPELRVTIDGERAPVIEINTLFAAVVVPSGEHDVVFRRRIGRGWWSVAGIGVAAWLALLVAGRIKRS